jgi:hypothetical protein
MVFREKAELARNRSFVMQKSKVLHQMSAANVSTVIVGPGSQPAFKKTYAAA